MQKVGLHCNYWNGTGLESSPDRLLRQMEAAGAEAMDFPTGLALRMTPQQRRAFGAAAWRAGIQITLNGGCSDADISHPDAVVRVDGLQKCRAAIRAAAELGSPVWSGVIYARWLGLPEGPLSHTAKAQMWERAVASLRTLCSEARPLGVDICIEVVNRFEAFLVNTAADGLRLADDVGQPNLKLLLDVFHMNIEEDRVTDALARAIRANRLGHLHISESNRRLPGMRATDICWEQLLSTVAKSDYSGAVILEAMVLSQAPAAHSFRTWRDMTTSPDLDGLTAEARSSMNFVRARLGQPPRP